MQPFVTTANNWFSWKTGGMKRSDVQCCSYFLQSMIVDQTIEKVSFCAPDRNHEKGFAYICRDGTTRRWMCHGFLAVKESVSVSIIYYDFSLSRRTAAEMCLMSRLLSKQPVLYITSPNDGILVNDNRLGNCYIC